MCLAAVTPAMPAHIDHAEPGHPYRRIRLSSHYIWDRFIRLFHWSLALLFGANALVIDPETDLHQWIGYSVMGLVCERLLWGVIGSKHARFANFWPSWSGCLRQIQDMATGAQHPHLGHSPLGAVMIFNLLASILVIGATGYLMTTDMFWGIEWPEDIHERAVTWVEISVGLHIAAVLFESRRTKVKLARAMVPGNKELPHHPEESSP